MPRQRITSYLKRNAITLCFFASAVIAWPIMAEMELFEEFYEFSRTHEDWDLDELALLVVNLTIALIFSVLVQSRRMRRLAAERSFQQARAEENARHDPLTGLCNRRAFTAAMAQYSDDVENGAEHIVAIIDLDRFKPINDLYGHAAGDLTLQTAAARLENTFGDVALVSRLGGDEFGLIFARHVDAKDAERRARRAAQELAEPIEFQEHTIHLSCSSGLVVWTKGIAQNEALRRADKALYNSKASGRGSFSWYDGGLDKESRERSKLEAELRQAIANEEIAPWFQPIIEIETSTLQGFEVLARWQHETKGHISPAVFVEIAEESGQIAALGQSLLRQACLHASHWDSALTVSFNLSPLQFKEPKLVEGIREVLRACDFDPKRLTIEVTESSVIHDFDEARHKLDALKALGVKIALDDFGTGYSSLASLRRLPFDRIKIDRSFISNIASEPQNQKIVTGIMALANGLELDVTAEGIETDSDLDYLQSLNCGLGQGFLFERALPADQIDWLLESQWSDGIMQAKSPDRETPAAQPKTA